MYDAEERELTLYPMGWSGNEGIIEALRYTAFWAVYRSTSMQGIYTFKFPKDLYVSPRSSASLHHSISVTAYRRRLWSMDAKGKGSSLSDLRIFFKGHEMLV